MDTLKNITKKDLGRFILNKAIYIVLLVMVIIMITIDSSLLSLNNLTFILSQASTRLILAVGVGGIIVLGGTDLSLGRTVGMAGVVSASLLQAVDYERRIFADMPELSLWIPIIGVMLISAAVSFVHSLFVSKLKVAPFIASLAVGLVVFGAESIYFDIVNDSSPIGGLSEAYKNFGQGAFNIFGFRLPYLIIYAAIVVLITWFIWNKTVLGKNMYAVGGNPEAATVSGISIVSTTTLIYIIAGLYYGLGGALEASRTGSAANTLGQSYELDAIAACVVGGVSLRGGVGSVAGIIAGVLIFQIISYGLVYMNVNPYVQYVIKGLIILFAVSVDTQKYIKRK